MNFNLTVTGDDGVMLGCGSDDMVIVPTRPSERAICRQALVDAILLLDQTEAARNVTHTETHDSLHARRASLQLVQQEPQA